MSAVPGIMALDKRRGVLLHRGLTAGQDWGRGIDPSRPAGVPRRGILSAGHRRESGRRCFPLVVLAGRLGGRHA